MHSLSKCKLCGKIFDPFAVPGRKGICLACYWRLEEVYSKVHEYIRSSKENVSFDPEVLAEETQTDPEDVDLLLKLGYLERDIQTWGSNISERGVLAGKFRSAMERMKAERKLTTYGGKFYSREDKS